MIFITSKTWQDNDVEGIRVDKIKWLNEKKHRKKVRSFKFNNDNSKILRR